MLSPTPFHLSFCIWYKSNMVGNTDVCAIWDTKVLFGVPIDGEMSINGMEVNNCSSFAFSLGPLGL